MRARRPSPAGQEPGASRLGTPLTPRYEARREANGSWTVDGRDADLPAVVDDVPQLGHSEQDARAVARELEDPMGEEDE